MKIVLKHTALAVAALAIAGCQTVTPAREAPPAPVAAAPAPQPPPVYVQPTPVPQAPPVYAQPTPPPQAPLVAAPPPVMTPPRTQPRVAPTPPQIAQSQTGRAPVEFQRPRAEAVPTNAYCDRYPDDEGVVILAIDQGSLLSTFTMDLAEKAVDKVINELVKPHQRLYGFILTDNAVTRTDVISACMPGIRPLTSVAGLIGRRPNSTDVKQHESEFKEAARTLLMSQLAPSRRAASRPVAIIDTLNAITAGEYKGKIKAVAIISHMFDGSLSIPADRVMSDFEKRSAFTANRRTMQLNGAVVHHFGLGTYPEPNGQRIYTLENPIRMDIASFWERLFTNAGASRVVATF